MNKTITLAEAETKLGYTEDDIRAFVVDSVVPGICFECEEHDRDVEPDARNYDCETCGGIETVNSLLVMLGFC